MGSNGTKFLIGNCAAYRNGFCFTKESNMEKNVYSHINLIHVCSPGIDHKLWCAGGCMGRPCRSASHTHESSSSIEQ
jgi:hypothetical protein